MASLRVTTVRYCGAQGGRAYRSAASLLLASVLSIAFLIASPSLAYGVHGDEADLPCSYCHKVHIPQVGDALLDVSGFAEAGAVANQTELCMFCHDVGADGSNKEIDDILIEGVSAPGLVSGHSVEGATTDPDLSNECSSCHDPHTKTSKLPWTEINGFAVDVATDPNTWCRACHDPDSDPNDPTKPDSNWSGVTGDAYYDQMYSSRMPDTYIGFGTFRGWDAYENNSAHSAIPASVAEGRAEGDCLWCHERHSSTSTYDNLKGDFGPSIPADAGNPYPANVNADACFGAGCHDDYVAKGYGSGHFIRSESPVSLEADAPLPCYECHNAHGSKNGNTMLIQDSLGAALDPSTPAGQSKFCYTCHLSAGSDRYGWSSNSSSMVIWSVLKNESGITTAVAGIPREDMIELPMGVTQHLSGNLMGCACHGSVHAPNPDAVSSGGQSCYDCHAYKDSMEYDGAGAKLSYHHVLGISGSSGDTAFAAGSYPGKGSTPDTDTVVYCLSCHVDHDKFYTGTTGPVQNRANNLRTSIGAETAASTDYITSGGVCLGCHDVVRKKDTVNQKPGDVAAAYTPAIGSLQYGRSAHGVKDDGTTLYAVASAPFADGTTFLANCSKCHNDNRAPEYYDSSSSGPTFGLHWSPARRILAALGRADYSNDPSAEERFCYSCHSPGGSPYKAAAKTGKDWYSTPGIAMKPASEDVYTRFISNQVARRSHGVAKWTGVHRPSRLDETSSVLGVTRFTAPEHVECADCHSPHAAGKVAVSGTKRTVAGLGGNSINQSTSPIAGVWGVGLSSNPAEWREPNYTVVEATNAEYQVCFKCHSGFNSSYTPDPAVNRSSGTFTWSTAAAWTNVALEFNPNNASYHPVMAKPTRPITQQMASPWNATRGSNTMYCSDCHMDSSGATSMGPHGSATTRILRGSWNPGSNTIRLGSMPADFLCTKCHDLPGTNVAHARSNHNTYSCGSCHIAIPHGGAAPRLLATTGTNGGKLTPAPYNAGTQLVNFAIPASGNGMKNSNCEAVAGACQSAHNSSLTGRTYWDW